MKQPKFKKVRTRKEIKNDPRVEKCWGDSDGWWILLHEEYHWYTGQVIHYYTVSELCDALNYCVHPVE